MVEKCTAHENILQLGISPNHLLPANRIEIIWDKQSPANKVHSSLSSSSIADHHPWRLNQIIKGLMYDKH